MIPDKAFILAAGFGTRMKPLTDTRPKPMVEINGRSLLLHAIDHCRNANIQNITINTHYLGEQITQHVADINTPDIKISHEDEILDTGGGLKNALNNFQGEDFFVISGDSFWIDDKTPALKALADAWDPKKMDLLMLLQPISTMRLTRGVGDYDLDDQGRATRSMDQSGAYMFTSLRINSSALFDDTPDEPFSYLKLMDRAQERGRLYGLVNTGDWHHISTPDDLTAVENGLDENTEQSE